MKLSISNFKSIKSLSLNISNLTVLTGLNSSGKSSVIDAFRMLYKKSTGNTPFLDKQGNFQDLLCEWFENDKKINFHIQEHSFEYNLDISDDSCFPAQGCFPYALYYVGAERLGAQLYSDNIRNLDKSDFTLWPNTLKYYDEHKSDIIKADILPSMKEDKALIYAIEEIFQKISPTSKLDVLTLPDVDISSLRVNNRRAPNVGFGISYLFPIVLSLLAFSHKNDTILILENPEAHIHPKGQSIIGELIAKVANSGTKIILETHSDHILSGIRIAVKERKIQADNVNVLFFNLEENKGQYLSKCDEININEDGRIANWPQNFFDQFELDLERLLR